MTESTVELPELPENHFWRVRRGSVMIRLELIERIPRRILGGFRERVVKWTTIPESQLSRKALHNEALGILRDLRRVDIVESLLGDYPPKK